MSLNLLMLPLSRAIMSLSSHSFIASMGLCALLCVPMSHAANQLTVNIELNILQPTCDVADVVVPLTQIEMDTFTSINHPFNIELTNCVDTTAVKVKFGDAADSVYNSNGLRFRIKQDDGTVAAFASDITVALRSSSPNPPIPFILNVERDCSTTGVGSCSSLTPGSFNVPIPFYVSYL